MNWIGYSLAAIGVVGVSDLFRKFASQMKDPFFANVAFQIGSITAALVYFLLFSRKIEDNPKLTLFSFIGGFLISTFTLISFKALALGPGASTVIPVLRIGGITLLVLLGVFFLREQLSGAKIIGLGLSFMGLYLLFSK
jgi:uncharacterized membrane protein